MLTTLLLPPDLALLRQHNAGPLRAIAVTSAERLAATPQLPTIAEYGVPGYEASLWYGVVVPTGTPAALVSRLNAELAKAIQHPETRERLAAEGVRILGGRPEQFAEYLRNESVKWTKVIRDARIRLE